jgi:hypothetical protein
MGKIRSRCEIVQIIAVINQFATIARWRCSWHVIIHSVASSFQFVLQIDFLFQFNLSKNNKSYRVSFLFAKCFNWKQKRPIFPSHFTIYNSTTSQNTASYCCYGLIEESRAIISIFKCLVVDVQQGYSAPYNTTCTCDTNSFRKSSY